MRPGGGHTKGADFERWLAMKLSAWASNGERKDVFWRSPGSGARSRALGQKSDTSAHGGDIAATHELGREFIQHVNIECKCYTSFNWRHFLIEAKGELWTYWVKLCADVKNARQIPLMIVKENARDPLLITNIHAVSILFPSRYLAAGHDPDIDRYMMYTPFVYKLDALFEIPYPMAVGLLSTWSRNELAHNR